jgi:uncharacterized membrane protein HdeD (DUF308 family)
VTRSKLTVGEVVAGAAGAVLVVSLFGPWFDGESAWRALTVVLALLLIAAALGIVLFVATLYQRSQAYPVAAEVFAFAFAALTVVVLLFEVGLRAQPGWAAWIGLAAVLAVAAGSWAAMRAHVRP